MMHVYKLTDNDWLEIWWNEEQREEISLQSVEYLYQDGSEPEVSCTINRIPELYKYKEIWYDFQRHNYPTDLKWSGYMYK